MRISSVWLSLLLLSAAPLLALDKEHLALHLRKALNLDTRAEIIAGEPRPSDVGDLWEVPVTVGGGQYVVFLSKDEKKYIWGYSIDLTEDPDKERAKGISLTNVHAKGSANAPVTIVEYSDMQCPHCQKAHEMIEKELFQVYTSTQVRWVFKHFPLSMHDWAETAAIASECAAKQKEEAFWTVTGSLFQNAKQIKKEDVLAKSKEYAKAAGLNVDKFSTCVKSSATISIVQSNKQEGSSVGVTSTPSLFINGRMRRGFGSFEDIKVVIEEKLRETPAK